MDNKLYTPELFLKYVNTGPITPDKVRKQINLDHNVSCSWNTAVKYLDGLVGSGVLRKVRVGAYNTYFKV